MSHWYNYLMARFPQIGQCKESKWLSLCCGSGELERYFAEKGTFASCLAVDISEEAIQRAKKSANEAGISTVEYRSLDLNSHLWEVDNFDVIIAQGGVHHISNLRHFFAQMQNCLKPSGVFVMHEYVGASRLKFPERQVEVINALMHLIPAKFRLGNMPYVAGQQIQDKGTNVRNFQEKPIKRGIQILREGDFGRAWRAVESRLWDASIGLLSYVRGIRYGQGSNARLFRPEKSWKTLHFDQSESIRSSEIIQLISRYLDVVEIKGLGGTALWWLQDFDWTSNTDEDFLKLIEMLLTIEETLISIGDLKPDVVHIAAQKHLYTHES
jgi:SAM-dependent methyltransferase